MTKNTAVDLFMKGNPSNYSDHSGLIDCMGLNYYRVLFADGPTALPSVPP